jgi:hypothetical protein
MICVQGIGFTDTVKTVQNLVLINRDGIVVQVVLTIVMMEPTRVLKLNRSIVILEGAADAPATHRVSARVAAVKAGVLRIVLRELFYDSSSEVETNISCNGQS